MVIVMTPQRVIFHIKLIKKISYFNINRVNSFFFPLLKFFKVYIIYIFLVCLKKLRSKKGLLKKTHFYSKELI